MSMKEWRQERTRKRKTETGRNIRLSRDEKINKKIEKTKKVVGEGGGHECRA